MFPFHRLTRSDMSSTTNEKVYPPPPPHWKPPIVPHPIWGQLPLLLYRLLALVSVHELTLDEHWKGKCDDEIYQAEMSRLVGQISNGNIVCGLILSATAAFITTTPPVPSIFNYNTTPAYVFLTLSFTQAALSIICGTAVVAIYQSCKRDWCRDVLTGTRFRLYAILLLMAWPAISLFISILFLIIALLFAVLTPRMPWIYLGVFIGLVVEWLWTFPCFVLCAMPLKSKKQDPEAQMSTIDPSSLPVTVAESLTTCPSRPRSSTTMNSWTQQRAATFPDAAVFINYRERMPAPEQVGGESSRGTRRSQTV